MAIVVALALVVGSAGASAWAVHLIRVGARDSGDLAVKLAIPFPTRAADWPELRLDAVVPDPESTDRVLLLARWPAHPECRALLVLDVETAALRGHRLLMHWRDVDASLAPDPIAGDRLLLRRRRTNDTVIAVVVRETGFVGDMRA